MKVRQTTFTVLGMISVALGAAGILLPFLPTTPFLLLSAYLFAKSSPRRHDWLINHKRLGPYIHAWRNKTGLTVAQKLRIGISFTVVIGVSIYFSPMVSIKYMLACGWAFWMIMLLRQKTLRIAPTPASQM